MKVGIVGATGYAGQELVRLIIQHPKAELAWITSNTYKGKDYHRCYGNYTKIYEATCLEQDLEKLCQEVDVIFLATPHGLSSSLINKDLLDTVKIIDLSADFRLKDKEDYKNWYNQEHTNPSLLKDAVYGLCELNREQVKKAQLIANPGCYPTASILGVYPLLKEQLIDHQSILIDAKSGVSGAGRAPRLGTHYNEVNESTKAYGIGTHRHTAEIEEQYSYACDEKTIINFTPHLVPMHRGILATAYATLKENYSYDDIKAIYNQYYSQEKFVRVLDKDYFPETRWVKGSNYCDIGFKIDERTNRIVVVSAIDNLIKGAAGQAVQNLNILYDLEEDLGLEQIPVFM
ncbi:N-acetyl-gamma-glutamyl-phosphate reductase [Natranaerovirga hydrolytica]|uniref:N-acetyl-gamma-glutamyl-phosphate reductase n=1 Tax=Natranaerovirga hydrolytica TaxID=680378 RepID=A0A4R1N6Z9_9FIRM|nr:N-acetyl-gamma-glutamyl-phosphate reductase [Natranaerovirga hydrolytica]TCK98423.1 N-acetyl-gamma-glutamyl-phosphate reductase [Natranaerovirga hydrolytica]